jgi:CheY-like chemotaxis protein
MKVDPMPRAAPRLVLVVEDEPLLRMDAVDMIKEAGFEVLEASNADEAILLLETRLDKLCSLTSTCRAP